MERMPGEVFRTRAQTDPLGDERRRALAMAMMDTLAALHSVEPTTVGLGDFGRPEGFLARQVRRWAGQLDRSRSRALPGIDELRDRLAATAPEGANAGRIVHGDYRLDNLPRLGRPGRRARGARLGDGHPRRPARRPGAAADLLGRARRQRHRRGQPRRRRARPARRLPDRRRADRPVRRPSPTSTSGRCTGTWRWAASSSRSSARASTTVTRRADRRRGLRPDRRDGGTAGRARADRRRGRR